MRHRRRERLERLPQLALRLEDEAQELAAGAAAAVHQLAELLFHLFQRRAGRTDERRRTVFFFRLIDQPDLVKLVLRLALELRNRTDHADRFALHVAHQLRRRRIADLLFHAVFHVEPLRVAPDLRLQAAGLVHDRDDPVGTVVLVALFLQIRHQPHRLEFGIDGQRAHLCERLVAHAKNPFDVEIMKSFYRAYYTLPPPERERHFCDTAKTRKNG